MCDVNIFIFRARNVLQAPMARELTVTDFCCPMAFTVIPVSIVLHLHQLTSVNLKLFPMSVSYDMIMVLTKASLLHLSKADLQNIFVVKPLPETTINYVLSMGQLGTLLALGINIITI